MWLSYIKADGEDNVVFDVVNVVLNIFLDNTTLPMFQRQFYSLTC